MIERLLNPIRRRLRLLIGRGVVTLINDDEALQELQIRVLAGEVHDGVERFQQYGFTAHPHPGAEHVVLFPGGVREHGLVIAVDDRRYRMKSLAQGEVAIYTDQGDMIHFKRGGTIQVKAATKLQVDTPLAEFSGDIVAEGDITDRASGAGRSMNSMRDVYDGHTHPGDSGGTTGTPNQDMG